MVDYYNGLSEVDKARYNAKLCVKSVNYGDPYRVDASEWTLTGRRWPPVTMINITVYLLFTPSRFTADTLQAYKSLEAYNYFESGKQGGIPSPTEVSWYVFRPELRRIHSERSSGGPDCLPVLLRSQ